VTCEPSVLQELAGTVMTSSELSVDTS
jgi:hypothetical protein